MPKGVYPHTHVKPKSYSPELVDRVEELYSSGLTQAEVANAVGLTQKVIWRLMKNHSIAARVAAKRDQLGTNNHMWAGQSAGYQALHLRVAQLRGKPTSCARCPQNDPDVRYEWASLTGKYEDPSDYERMCLPCHRRYDGERRAAMGERTSPVWRSA